MNRQAALRRFGWILLVSFSAAALLTGPSRAQGPSGSSLEGLWRTDGYGQLIEFKGNELRQFEITAVSCIPGRTAELRASASGPSEIVYAAEGEILRSTSGTSPDTRWLHEDGSVSSVFLHRTESRPEVCNKPLAETPENN